MALTKAIVLMKLRLDVPSGSNELHWLVRVKMYACILSELFLTCWRGFHVYSSVLRWVQATVSRDRVRR